ncbi:MAG: exopolyphosphatase [Gammaproteobacteria bacterium]|nr:exopolyphosphatase [Gammaproteobacteria bacterium]MDE2344959.1 exopolyphosphatase [Gammaproteobacteria bacterium]
MNTGPLKSSSYPLVAAVDLGSNSFHLMVAELQGSEIRVIDRLREMLRFGSGLDAQGRITALAARRALSCLRRFGQRLQTLNAGQVRAVGTNTLRKARNAEEFLRRAEAALGHPIEIISGVEEARLIYQGVTSVLPADQERRLVVDIGGGSTELIIGRGSQPHLMESLFMGCVSLTDMFFPKPVVTRRKFRDALLYARQQLEPVQAELRRQGWQRAIGSSGSIRGIENVCHTLGWQQQGISLECLQRLAQHLIDEHRLEHSSLPGLGEERIPIFAGGLVVLTAVFEALGLRNMQVSSRALREGVIQDLAGRLKGQDARADSVEHLAMRYAVDIHQVKRVESTAMQIFNAVSRVWRLDNDCRRLLSWAAWLHECGLAVAHSGYHKHGAYIVANTDMAGFSRQEQILLAALVRLHRRKFAMGVLEALDKKWQLRLQRLAVILRLAVLLHRGRDDRNVPKLRARARGSFLQVKIARGWIEKYPLTYADIIEEKQLLRASGTRLSLT